MKFIHDYFLVTSRSEDGTRCFDCKRFMPKHMFEVGYHRFFILKMLHINNDCYLLNYPYPRDWIFC